MRSITCRGDDTGSDHPSDLGEDGAALRAGAQSALLRLLAARRAWAAVAYHIPTRDLG